MRLAIFGSGGVGGYFGARLAAAGHDVHFIARGAHLEAMRSRGLRVESALGNEHVARPQVHADPAEIGAVDFVLFAVKTLARAPVGVCRADAELRATFEAAMDEAWGVGRKRGVNLPDDFVADRLKFVDGLHADMRTSMQHDLEAGKPLEAPWLCGAVVRMCAETGLAAPVNRTIYAALKPYLHGSARAAH